MENRSMTDNNMAMGVTMPEIGREDIRDRNSTLSRTFSAVKWFLALTVVADHFLSILMQNPGGKFFFVDYPFLNEIVLFFSAFFKNYEVPVFFFMSGYLLYTGESFSMKSYKPVLKRKLWGLFKPYMIWWLIGLIIMVLFTIVMIRTYGEDTDINTIFIYEGVELNIPRTLFKLIGMNFFPEVNVSLWYLRVLMIALCMVPVIKWVIKYVDWRFVLLILAIMFVGISHDQRDIRVEVTAFFFTLGYLLRAKDVNIIQLSRRIFPYAAIFYVAIGAFFIYEFCKDADSLRAINVAKSVNIILGVPLVLYSFYFLVSRNIIAGSAFLASASFFFYVAHYPLCHIVYQAGLGIYQPEPGSIGGILLVVGSYLFIVFFLLGMYYLLDRYFPRVRRFLSAGR